MAIAILNSFGYRSSDAGFGISSAQGEVQTVANETINRVDTILQDLKETGGDSLDAAVSAIEALGAFRPSKITVTYQGPEFNKASFTPAPEIELTAGGAVNAPPEAALTNAIQTAELPDIGGQAPTTPVPAIPSAPGFTLTQGAPVEPTAVSVIVPAAPDARDLGEFSAPQLVLPTLRELNLPEFQLPTLPEFQLPSGATPPELPQFVVNTDLRRYNPSFVVDQSPTLLDPAMETIGRKLIDREIRMSSEVLLSRNADVLPEVIQSQIALATERSAFLNNAELRRRKIDEAQWDNETLKMVLAAAVQADGMTFEASLALARSAFESETLNVSAQIDVAKAATALYNARVAELNIAADLYKTEVEAKLASLAKWKAEIEAESAKARVNDQLARNYVTLVQSLTVKAELYSAEVQALFSQVEAHKARMQAVQAEAEAARSELSVYGGKTDAYIAALAAYKAEFEAYAVQMRGVSAQNQAEAAKTQISVAQLQAAGAEIGKVISQIELDSENLKLQAQKNSAEYENRRLKNTIESIRAQIDADAARIDILEWSANTQLKDSQNEAIADNARAASRYYNSASDAAYRAADQAFRAVMSSTQAAAAAQEAAARSAASVAQGAYSAIHVSARLSGGGSIEAQEDRADRVSVNFSDMLNDYESRVQRISA